MSGLREAWSRLGLVFETTPMQVVKRLEELGFIEDWAPGTRRLFTAGAHLAYGVGTRTLMGLLRR